MIRVPRLNESSLDQGKAGVLRVQGGSPGQASSSSREARVQATAVERLGLVHAARMSGSTSFASGSTRSLKKVEQHGEQAYARATGRIQYGQVRARADMVTVVGPRARSSTSRFWRR